MSHTPQIQPQLRLSPPQLSFDEVITLSRQDTLDPALQAKLDAIPSSEPRREACDPLLQLVMRHAVSGLPGLENEEATEVRDVHAPKETCWQHAVDL